MKKWLDCCMDVCSSYKYGSDIGLKRLSYQSKIISINIRISLITKGESETCPISEISTIMLSLKFIGSFEAAVFSFTNLFFLPSRFSLLSSSRSLCCLSHFFPTASRKKRAGKNSLSLERNAKYYAWLKITHTNFARRQTEVNFPSGLAQLSENPVDCVCGRSLFAKQANFFSAVFSIHFFHQKETL